LRSERRSTAGPAGAQRRPVTEMPRMAERGASGGRMGLRTRRTLARRLRTEHRLTERESSWPMTETTTKNRPPTVRMAAVLHFYVRNFFIEPPPDTQRKERQGERGIWVAMSCYLLHATPPPPPSPHRASVAPPAAMLSGLAEGRLLPPLPPPTYPPLLNLNSFQRPRLKSRTAFI
jgi:hypothetical protein